MALKVTHQPKPVTSITKAEIPPELVEAMTAEWTFLQANPDYEVVLTGDTQAEAKQYYLCARAWGNGHLPRLTVRKLPARTGEPDNQVRLTVKVFDESAPRPGRPAPSAK